MATTIMWPPSRQGSSIRSTLMQRSTMDLVDMVMELRKVLLTHTTNGASDWWKIKIVEQIDVKPVLITQSLQDTLGAVVTSVEPERRHAIPGVDTPIDPVTVTIRLNVTWKGYKELHRFLSRDPTKVRFTRV